MACRNAPAPVISVLTTVHVRDSPAPIMYVRNSSFFALLPGVWSSRFWRRGRRRCEQWRITWPDENFVGYNNDEGETCCHDVCIDGRSRTSSLSCFSVPGRNAPKWTWQCLAMLCTVRDLYVRKLLWGYLCSQKGWFIAQEFQKNQWFIAYVLRYCLWY